jgi:hypothetical protein
VSLPNGDQAIVESEKLTRYILNEDHPRGRNQARVFRAALGLTAADAPALEAALRGAAEREDAHLERTDAYGDHFRLDFPMDHNGRVAQVRSLWVIRLGETIPRLVSAFVL